MEKKIPLFETETINFLEISSSLKFTESDEDTEIIFKKSVPLKEIDTQTKILRKRESSTLILRPPTKCEGNQVKNYTFYDEDIPKTTHKSQLEDVSIVVNHVLSDNEGKCIEKAVEDYVESEIRDTLRSCRFKPKVLQEMADRDLVGAEIIVMVKNPLIPHIIAAGVGIGSKGAVAFFSLKNSRRVDKIFDVPAPIASIKFSLSCPNQLGVGMRNGDLWIFDCSKAKGQLMRKFTMPTKAMIKFIDWWFFPDQPDVLIYSLRNRVIILHYPWIFLDKSKILLDLKHTENQIPGVTGLTMGPDVTCILRHPRDSEFYLVGTEEGNLCLCKLGFQMGTLYTQKIKMFRAHERGVRAMKPLPHNDKAFVTCGCDGRIKVWFIHIDEPIINLVAERDYDEILDVSWSPRNVTVAVAVSREKIHVWDFRRRVHKPIATLELKTELLNVQFSENGNYLLVGTKDGRILYPILEEMPPPEKLKSQSFLNSVREHLNYTGRRHLCEHIKD